MSNHFENLRELGKRIDEGIEHLENKLANPYSLGVVTSKSAALCEKTIEKLENEMKDLLENIEPFIKEETEDLEEIQGDIDAVNDFMKKLIDNINVMESRLRNKPDYVPFSMPIQDNFSPVSPVNSVIDDCSVANTSILKDLTNSENLIGNESPNLLVSPNYISTPEPGSSCRRFSASSRKPTNLTPFQKIWQKHNQSPDISHLSENMSRLDTPGNLSRNSNRSFLRNQPQLPKVPAMHNGGLKKKEIIESPKEPECSFQVFRRPHYQRNYNYN